MTPGPDIVEDPQAQVNAASDRCQAMHPYLGGLLTTTVGPGGHRCELRAGHTGDHQLTANPRQVSEHRHTWSNRAGASDITQATAPPVVPPSPGGVVPVEPSTVVPPPLPPAA